MFTGLIESMGTVKKIGSALQIKSDKQLSLSLGDSLAVNGSCLTVTDIVKNLVSFDVSPETFSRIVSPVVNAAVNLERALAVSDRMHGHFVTGHIDTIGSVIKLKKTRGFSEITISYPEKHSLLLIEKGSIAVEGISLTVASLTEKSFMVAVIPETLGATTAGLWKPGYRVNLEFDIIGKYVVRAAKAAGASKTLRNYLEQY